MFVQSHGDPERPSLDISTLDHAVINIRDGSIVIQIRDKPGSLLYKVLTLTNIKGISIKELRTSRK